MVNDRIISTRATRGSTLLRSGMSSALPLRPSPRTASSSRLLASLNWIEPSIACRPSTLMYRLQSVHRPCCGDTGPSLALSDAVSRDRACYNPDGGHALATEARAWWMSRKSGHSQHRPGSSDFSHLACREFQVQKCRKLPARKVCFRGDNRPTLERGVLPSSDPLLSSAGWLYRTIGHELPSLGAEPVRSDASQCVLVPLAHA